MTTNDKTVPPECDPERVETVARAIFDAANPIVREFPDYWKRVTGGEDTRDHYRRLAAAAIAALPPSPAEEAVKRVEALAEEFDSATLPPLINDFDRGLVAGYARAAARLRAALASPAPAPQGEHWRCEHRPRCADAVCSYNPAMQRWIKGENR